MTQTRRLASRGCALALFSKQRASTRARRRYILGSLLYPLFALCDAPIIKKSPTIFSSGFSTEPRTRTETPLRAMDFESIASANSASPASLNGYPLRSLFYQLLRRRQEDFFTPFLKNSVKIQSLRFEVVFWIGKGYVHPALFHHRPLRSRYEF